MQAHFQTPFKFHGTEAGRELIPKDKFFVDPKGAKLGTKSTPQSMAKVELVAKVTKRPLAVMEKSTTGQMPVPVKRACAQPETLHPLVKVASSERSSQISLVPGAQKVGWVALLPTSRDFL